MPPALALGFKTLVPSKSTVSLYAALGVVVLNHSFPHFLDDLQSLYLQGGIGLLGVLPEFFKRWSVATWLYPTTTHLPACVLLVDTQTPNFHEVTSYFPRLDHPAYYELRLPYRKTSPGGRNWPTSIADQHPTWSSETNIVVVYGFPSYRPAHGEAKEWVQGLAQLDQELPLYLKRTYKPLIVWVPQWVEAVMKELNIHLNSLSVHKIDSSILNPPHRIYSAA